MRKKETMKWDIFGKKKTEQAIQELTDMLKKLQEQHSDLADLLKAHNDHLTNAMKVVTDKVTEIPLIAPRIRDTETLAAKEEKEEAIKYGLNEMWRV